MSHNVLLDLTDAHYHHQHQLTTQTSSGSSPSSALSSSSKFIPSRHNSNSWASAFIIPGNFHDTIILLKRIFWSHRWPRIFKFYLTLTLACIVVFTLFFNYSPTNSHTGGHKAIHHHVTQSGNLDHLRFVKNNLVHPSLDAIPHTNATSHLIDTEYGKDMEGIIEKPHHLSSGSTNESIQTSRLTNVFSSRGKFPFPQRLVASATIKKDVLAEKNQLQATQGLYQEGNSQIKDNTVESNIQSSHLTDQSHLMASNYEHGGHTPLNSYTDGSQLYETSSSSQAIGILPPYVSSSSLSIIYDPLIDRDFQKTGDFKKLNQDQLDVREAMQHSWKNYKRYAWGYDMLKPRAMRPDHWFNLGLTIVDSVDTLMMMNLADDANEALDWIESDLDFDNSNKNSNCFELTIRILGGLLSAYHLKPERARVLEKAQELGNRLLHCYDTGSGIIPNSDIDLAINQSHVPNWYPYSSLSEVSSIQLEFRDLTRLTGRSEYEQITFMTSLHLHNLTMQHNSALLTMYIDPNNGKMDNSRITLGARADSYYEYLLKQYLQTDIRWLENDYLKAIDETRHKLLRHTNGVMNLTFMAEVQKYHTKNGVEELDYQNKMDHLVCFLPGTLALGYYHFSPKANHLRSRHNLYTPSDRLNDRYDYHLDMAESIARTCYIMYNSTKTGLSPEIAFFSSAEDQSELIIQSNSAHNILRPEFVESLFYLYHITGKQIFREQARRVFDSFNNHCRVPGGYSPIADVRSLDSAPNLDRAPDRMESFWMSETLKYLYLIFCDDESIIQRLLNDYIFNTEAHIIPRNYPKSKFSTTSSAN